MCETVFFTLYHGTERIYSWLSNLQSIHHRGDCEASRLIDWRKYLTECIPNEFLNVGIFLLKFWHFSGEGGGHLRSHENLLFKMAASSPLLPTPPQKLDGLITDPPLNSATTLLKKERHMTPDTWQLICGTWHRTLTSDTWHLTFHMLSEVHIIWNFQVLSSYSLGMKVFWRFWGKGSVSLFINYKGVCRTAHATPGLLTTTIHSNVAKITISTIVACCLQWGRYFGF